MKSKKPSASKGKMPSKAPFPFQKGKKSKLGDSTQ
jgi:hypothetical protein